MYYLNNGGGWNKTHEQAETTPRLDSFELPEGSTGYIGICLEGRVRFAHVLKGRGRITLTPEGCYRGVEIGISRKPNGYGGEQVFFLCPECGKRVRYLYLTGDQFLCRKCAKLNYRSQQQTKDDMADFYKGMHYAEKNLSPPPWPIDGVSFVRYYPNRPKGMHQTTYRRHLVRFLKYRSSYSKRLISGVARLYRGLP